jgi:hypothetical protein
MIQGEINKKLPGSRLYQFSEKYFEQPGLEKIAQPIIADLQQEYSCRPHPSLARLFILLRGYSGFWKAIILYSLFSDEGNIRIFKSIGFFRLLGAAVGVIVAALSWRGNQTPGFVSLLPDVLTIVVSFLPGGMVLCPPNTGISLSRYQVDFRQNLSTNRYHSLDGGYIADVQAVSFTGSSSAFSIFSHWHIRSCVC